MQTAVPYRTAVVTESGSNERRSQTGSELHGESVPKAPVSPHRQHFKKCRTVKKKALRVGFGPTFIVINPQVMRNSGVKFKFKVTKTVWSRENHP